MTALAAFLHDWTDDPHGVKKAFAHLRQVLEHLDGLTVTFVPRPPITYSLRGVPTSGERPVAVMIDVTSLDDQRFLSVCFYADTVTDPEERGDVIPGGLFSQDARCFDLDSDAAEDVGYVETRLREAAAAFAR